MILTLLAQICNGDTLFITQRLEEICSFETCFEIYCSKRVSYIIRSNVLEFFQNTYIKRDFLEVLKNWFPKKIFIKKECLGSQSEIQRIQSQRIKDLRNKYRDNEILVKLKSRKSFKHVQNNIKNLVLSQEIQDKKSFDLIMIAQDEFYQLTQIPLIKVSEEQNKFIYNLLGVVDKFLQTNMISKEKIDEFQTYFYEIKR